MEKILTLQPYAHGQLNDGRHYQIISIPQLVVSINGELKYGDIELEIYNEGELKPQKATMRLSEYLSNVASIGNLFI